ncbi:MAG: linear amide C-N hydrolase [Sedimentisphaerales bacterium]|nr:linear amide C-N hydrolase [Sedimentisphaerales bacterium]
MAILQKRRVHLARALVVIGYVVLLLAEASFACTSFCLQDGDGLVFGRNFDWHLEHGLVIVNKRGIAKRALLLDPSDEPAKWVSKYGSVTFNQYGREMPCGGMNEAGLVLETMWLSETKYPARDARPAVMAWLQYQLDTCATVADVIASDKKVRAATMSPLPFHFLGCDREGNIATFEFLEGKLICHAGETLPVKVMANDTYDKSLAYLKQHAGFGGARETPYGSWGSLDRFVCAADRVKKYPSSSGGSIVEYAFETLRSVSQGDSTKWMIVYAPKKLAIHYKTLSCSETRTIHLADCDFDARTPVQVISINTSHTGLLNRHFYRYDTDLNRWLVYYSMKHTSQLAFIPDAHLEVLIQYPDAPATEYLTDWEVAGPYEQEGKSCAELFDAVFDPERSGTEVSWRPLPVSAFSERPAYLDLSGALKGGAHKVAYLRTQITADTETSAHLDIYSDDGVKAWLNGQLVHANSVRRGISSGPDTVQVTLKKGGNSLLLKVTQDTGDWGAIVCVRPASMTPVEAGK